MATITKELTIYQALLVEFDLVCIETGWAEPDNEAISVLAGRLNELGSVDEEQAIQAAVVGWMCGANRT